MENKTIIFDPNTTEGRIKLILNGRRYHSVSIGDNGQVVARFNDLLSLEDGRKLIEQAGFTCVLDLDRSNIYIDTKK